MGRRPHGFWQQNLEICTELRIVHPENKNDIAGWKRLCEDSLLKGGVASAVRIIALLGVFEARDAGDNAMVFSILRGRSKESKLDWLKKWLNNNKTTY